MSAPLYATFQHFAGAFETVCKFANVRPCVELSPALYRSADREGSPMVKEALAGLIAVVIALGMTTAVFAQTPAPKAEEKKPAETMEKKTDTKPAEKKPAAKKEAAADKKAADAKAPAAKAEKKDEKPAEAKK
jgi:hypothetical protein